MPPGPRLLKLLLPKWVLLHLVTIAVCGAMIWLGRWQWDAAHRHHGEIRNYAYALQWWAFTGFTLVMWLRIVRDYLHPGRLTSTSSTPAVDDVEEPARYIGYLPPTERPVDHDPERARFNAYLAELNSADREDPA